MTISEIIHRYPVDNIRFDELTFTSNIDHLFRFFWFKAKNSFFKMLTYLYKSVECLQIRARILMTILENETASFNNFRNHQSEV